MTATKERPTLYASAPTLERCRELAVEFYCGSTVTLAEIGPALWSVSTGKGLTSLVIRCQRGRYRLESRADA